MARLTGVCAIFAAVTLAFLGISDAKIDPETAVGVWLMDEGKGKKTKDFSGNGNHGTIIGAQWADGVFGSALSFDGDGDFVDCGNAEILHISTGSMAAWINIATVDDGGLSAVTIPYDDGPAWDAPFRSLGLGTWGGQLRYWIAIDGENLEMHPGNIDTNRWYHQALTFDGKTRKAYLDGKLVFEAKSSGEILYKILTCPSSVSLPLERKVYVFYCFAGVCSLQPAFLAITDLRNCQMACLRKL